MGKKNERDGASGRRKLMNCVHLFGPILGSRRAIAITAAAIFVSMGIMIRV